MQGFITRREVIRHTLLVVRLYGWRVYWKCLSARQGATFLAIAMEGK